MSRKKRSRRGEGQGISFTPRRDDRVAVQMQQPLSVPADTRILMIPNLTEDEREFLKTVVANALEGYRAIH